MRAALLGLLVASVLFAGVIDVASAGSKNNCKGKNASRPECQVPEVPWTLVLPAAGAVLASGYYLIQRRRSASSPASSPEA